MTIPAWVNSAIFYQIFPDRFSNGDPLTNPENIRPWNEKPTSHSFFGGDLRGIEQHLDYIAGIGANALYLNPIFLSPSTHRYNTVDYFQIDPKLGDIHSFQSLLARCHSLNIHVILDGVFNHCGRGFYAFSDVLENASFSPYKDWFHIKKFPVDAYSPGDAVDYDGWWKHKSLPKFNYSHKKVREYIFSIADYWIKQGVDGWRLDVPNEIDDDEFWFEFRSVVKKANSEAYLVGEIWDINPRWIGDSHFDGLMNYPFRNAIIDVLTKKITPCEYTKKIMGQLIAYPRENNYAMMNLLGSHDVERIATVFQKNTIKVKQAIFLLMTSLGCPTIYYGDEVGLEGGKDPDCRRTFPWDQNVWNLDIHAWTKLLIDIRNKNKVFSKGDYHPLSFVDFPDMVGYCRNYEQDRIIGLINLGDSTYTFSKEMFNDHLYTDVRRIEMLPEQPEHIWDISTIRPSEIILLKQIKI